MKILVTGAKGFIGKNLVVELKNRGHNDILEFDKDNTVEELSDWCREADFVFHLAGINRPITNNEFYEGNFDLTQLLIENLKKNEKAVPVMFSSTIHAASDSDYGKSKKLAEETVFKYGRENNVDVYVYRFKNVFGKWSRPNYNSVVSTFCHNIANEKEIIINSRETELTLIYIDDLINEVIGSLDGHCNRLNEYCYVKEESCITLGELAETLYSFKESRKNCFVPSTEDQLKKKLYSTFLSYLPVNNFSYELDSHLDERGSFTEVLKTLNFGQVSVNISKPGIIKGNHWHHTKNEKFLVVSGEGVIRFRNINSKKVYEYFVSGEKLEVVDIPVGYTHNIENLGKEDMVTIMWANEVYDPNNPDTYYLEV